MNESFEDMMLSDEEANEIMKKFTSTTKPKETRYQYPYVELEYVMDNPDEYIIPQCQPACRVAWGKNIETFMVSNDDDNDLYVLFQNLSEENKELLKKIMQSDPRFFYSEYRGTYGIGVKGNDDRAKNELTALVDVLKIQDTKRFQTTEEFLESYKLTGGEMKIDEFGHIIRMVNPELSDISLSEALKRAGKEDLYIASEGRVYDSPIYLEWHNRYKQALEDELKSQVSELGSNRDNINGDASHLRDTFLEAEREYISELIKHEGMRQLIEEINQMPSDALFQTAQKIVDSVENGQVPDDQMERTEQQLTIILAAIHDKVLIKDLVKTYDDSAPSKSR